MQTIMLPINNPTIHQLRQHLSRFLHATLHWPVEQANQWIQQQILAQQQSHQSASQLEAHLVRQAYLLLHPHAGQQHQQRGQQHVQAQQQYDSALSGGLLLVEHLLSSAQVSAVAALQDRCPRCHSTNIRRTLVQRRSADEGMSCELTCRVCNHEWVQR